MLSSTNNIMNRLATALLVVLALCLMMCGGQTQEEAPSAEEPTEQPLTSEEMKAVSDEASLEAEESITEENAEDEYQKLEAEIAADG